MSFNPTLGHSNLTSPPQVCQAIECMAYAPLTCIIKHSSAKDLLTDYLLNRSGSLAISVYQRLVDEVNQMMRNDLQVLFPLIYRNWEKHCYEASYPCDFLTSRHIRILNMLHRLRQMLHFFVAEKDERSLHATDLIYKFEQLVQTAIYLKENYLLPMLSNNDGKHAN